MTELRKIWEAFKDLPHYHTYLKYVGSFDEEQYNQLLEWDLEQDDLYSSLERSWEEWNRTTLRKNTRDLETEIDPEEVKAWRLEFLREELKKLGERLSYVYERNAIMKRNGVQFWLRDVILEVIHDEVKISEMYRRYCNQTYFIQKGEGSDLTDDMIVAARKFPIDGIITFASGFAICPYHGEKSPSFAYWKTKNLAHCFGCTKTVDGIQLVMDIGKMQFSEAVKKLANL